MCSWFFVDTLSARAFASIQLPRWVIDDSRPDVVFRVATKACSWNSFQVETSARAAAEAATEKAEHVRASAVKKRKAAEREMDIHRAKMEVPSW